MVLDYLHVVDDVGKLLDYPADKNPQQIEKLRMEIQSALVKKGFKGTVDFALISSGLGLNSENGFEDYLGGKLQELLIYSPFTLIQSMTKNQEQMIRSFADAQSIAFVPVTKKDQAFYDDLRMNSLSFDATKSSLLLKEYSESSIGVLHIRAVYPRISFMKAMRVSLLPVGLTVGSTYIGNATPVGVPHSTGLLFDNASGEVIWKNQVSGGLSRFGKQSKARFFKGFPNIGQQN